MQQIFKNQITVPIFDYPANLENRWTRAFVRVQTPSTAMPDVWALASFDNVNKTVSGASEAGTFQVNLNAIGPVGSLTPGHKYVVEPANNDPNFVIEVARVISPTLFEVQDPLPQPVPNASLIRGFRASYELEPEHVTN